MSETTLRDTLSEALENYEATPEPVVNADPVVTETETEKADRLRDEAGRFAKKPEEEIQADPAPVVEEKPKTPRPSSWKKDYEQDWEVLPDRIREYINEREGQYAKGVSTYKNQWDQAQPIYEAVAPFIPELQQYGIQPGQWIQNLGNAHRTLALGSPEQKLEMFSKLANEYGVPLQALTGQPHDPQFSMLAQELNQIKNQWNSFQTQQQQAEQAALNAEIAKFAESAPHFESVKPTMAQLLQSGVATDLKTAYDKAIRLHDDLWNQQQAEHAKAEEAKRLADLAAKKAKAVSPKSASPTGSMNAGSGKKSLRDQLSESMESMSGLI